MPELDRRNLLTLASAGGLAVASAVLLRATSPDDDRVTRGRGRATSFGSVAVLDAVRRPRNGDGTPTSHSVADLDDGANHEDDHGWPDLVRVRVEVHNGTAHPLLASLGQFRLRVATDGPTVTPFAWQHDPGALAPRSTRTSWVDYLAPPDDDLWVEFEDAGEARPATLPFRLEVTRDA
ncbi:MAG TPA: hypothetical protein VFH10_13570 [Nocardioides sp.]|uniref:hypothetical protein n=1 Tax=Nocardioides sp. TaxID=35761 RepID=UPI002D804A4D|nr:hypothetical protein [Nocardioides sp.]HET6653668.1 hypothetical protein [Nocardioides sp.]